MELSKYIDSTNLNQTSTIRDIEKLCDDAIKYHFRSVCVYPYYVPLAHELLKDTDVDVCTVVGFPMGMNTTSTKEECCTTFLSISCAALLLVFFTYL